MKLVDYLRINKLSYRDAARMLGVTRQQVHMYATSFTVPSLEVGAMIVALTDGAVQIDDLIPAKKRKRTRPDDVILRVDAMQTTLKPTGR